MNRKWLVLFVHVIRLPLGYACGTESWRSDSCYAGGGGSVNGSRAAEEWWCGAW